MANLQDLRIDRDARDSSAPVRRRTGVWIGAALLIVLLAAGAYAYRTLASAVEVDTVRVTAASSASAPAGVILNATGYIVAAHKIEVGSKVMGKVAWIGVDKGDHVQEGQVMVRLEDEEYRAQLEQARGQLLNLQAHLAELEHGSRPQEIAGAKADLEQARADMINARITLNRTRQLVDQKIMSSQSLDDAQAKYDAGVSRVSSLEERLRLTELGPRQEQIDAARGQVVQAKGTVDFYQTQLNNTVVKAPVTGTILEREVEKGEFVTTGFVGDRGAKGYVVSLADLNDLEVELDISQNDFAKLAHDQRGWVTTDAYPDRRYDGYIRQISPEANRQKATVQVKVKILKPDALLRPDMNATVAFYSEEKAGVGAAAPKPVIVIPASAVHDGAVFVVLDGHAVRRTVTTGATSTQGVRIEQGLNGGEDLIANPPAGLKDGDRVRLRKGQA
ncbi:MAG TPA: efflux RND transporter periplasmic adaptor subunit [Bryobacteraceae bacterium]|nr:efflux RND transporter periplasmic adaptor subunit [Bryobacteraceae bacterium]